MHKGDQEGNKGTEQKTCYCNILKPACCIGLALIVQVLRGNLREKTRAREESCFTFYSNDHPEEVN